MANAALQLYSIRELMKEDVYRALKNTKKSGYDGIEFAGFYDIKASVMKKYLDELGLKACGSHTSWDMLSNDISEVFKYNKTIDNKNIILPYIDESFRKNAKSWTDTANKLNLIGKKCSDNGFNLAYHNHAFEFEKFDTVSGYQILVDNLNAEYVMLQPDLGWVSFAGEDVNEFLQRYKSLILSIHVKQFKNVGSHDATEINKGMVYYPPIIKNCIELGIDWFIIEQEGFEIPILDSIKENCSELKKMF